MSEGMSGSSRPLSSSIRQLQQHVVSAIAAATSAQTARLPASLLTAHRPAPLPPFPSSATAATALSAAEAGTAASARLHSLLSNAMPFSHLLAPYSPQLSLLFQLLRDCLRSYLQHLCAFYVTVLPFLCSHPALRSMFSRHSLSSSLILFLRSALYRVGSLASRLLSVVDYLLAPRLYFRLLGRHTLALCFFFLLHAFYRLCVHPTLAALHGLLRSLFIHPSYLHKEQRLQQRMARSLTYRQWKKAANALDRLQGQYRWKEQSRSPHYDWHRIRDDLAQFRLLVDSRDVAGIMTYSRARLYRNLVGINDRRLYSVLRAGTKRLIEEYISEVVRALQLVCVIESEDVSAADKLAFFNETRHAFGRSALLLSGGATLGLYHTGVIKALHDNHLLPRVLSGASVGSIVVAMLGTRTDEEIRRVFSDDAHLLRLDFFPHDAASTQRTLTRLLTTGTLMDITVLRACVKANVPNLTFQEAYDRSGRIINIVVSPAITSGNQDSLRLLNYLTAPNVLVWSAALASCAIPGIYAPVELMCQGEDGRERKWLEGDVRWQDGSVQADLPMERLRELFNINHFIVSQVNPHVLPFLRPLSASASLCSASSPLLNALPRVIDLLSSSIKSTLLTLLSAVPFPFQSPIRFMLDQTYVGDITIVPPITAGDYTLLLKNPSAQRLSACLSASEQATWRMLSMIRGACEIEMALDDGVRRMRGQLILQEVAEARKVERLSRVRSWSTDFEGQKRDRRQHEAEDRRRGGAASAGAEDDEGRSEEEEDGSALDSDSIREGDDESADRDNGDSTSARAGSRSRRSTAGSSRVKSRLTTRRHVSTEQSDDSMSPEAPLRRSSEPVSASPSHPNLSSHASIPGPPSLAGHHSQSNPPPASLHQQLHLPSTTAAHASHISALDGRNAASVFAHRSVGESVAHAYVLASKSIKRATEAALASSAGGSGSAGHGSHAGHVGSGGSRTAGPTPRRGSSARQDDLNSPARSRTPPAPASESGLSYDELILSRQSSARLQQLLRANTQRGAALTNGQHATEEAAGAAPGQQASSSNGGSAGSSYGSTYPSVSMSPSQAESLHSLTLPARVMFRPVQRRHLSTRDLQRLDDARQQEDDADAADSEDEERGWNEMMVRSDSDSDDSEDGDSDAEQQGNGNHAVNQTAAAPAAAAAASAASRTSASVPSTPRSHFDFLRSLLPFQSLHRSLSSDPPKPPRSSSRGRGQRQPPATSKHSASHDRALDVAGAGGGSSGRLLDAAMTAAVRAKRLPRNLSLNELASDLCSIP